MLKYHIHPLAFKIRHLKENRLLHIDLWFEQKKLSACFMSCIDILHVPRMPVFGHSRFRSNVRTYSDSLVKAPCRFFLYPPAPHSSPVITVRFVCVLVLSRSTTICGVIVIARLSLQKIRDSIFKLSNYNGRRRFKVQVLVFRWSIVVIQYVNTWYFHFSVSLYY